MCEYAECVQMTFCAIAPSPTHNKVKLLLKEQFKFLHKYFHNAFRISISKFSKAYGQSCWLDFVIFYWLIKIWIKGVEDLETFTAYFALPGISCDNLNLAPTQKTFELTTLGRKVLIFTTSSSKCKMDTHF